MASVLENNARTLKIEFTDDYEKFGFLAENRPISRRRIEREKKSLIENGWLDVIKVNKNFKIIDGQARLIAGKELKWTIPYLQKSDNNPKDMITLNNSKHWSTSNFLHYWVTHNKASYIVLQELCAQYKISLDTARSYAHLARVGGTQDDIMDKFKNGEFEFRDYDKTIQVLDNIEKWFKCTDGSRYFTEIFNHSYFNRATLWIMVNVKYKNNHMLNRFKAGGTKELFRCSDSNSYKKVLSDIYNVGLPMRDKILFRPARF